MNLEALQFGALDAALTTAVGLLLFILVWWLLAKALPFDSATSLGKRKNPAVAVVMLSILLGLGIIVSAAVRP